MADEEEPMSDFQRLLLQKKKTMRKPEPTTTSTEPSTTTSGQLKPTPKPALRADPPPSSGNPLMAEILKRRKTLGNRGGEGDASVRGSRKGAVPPPAPRPSKDTKPSPGDHEVPKVRRGGGNEVGGVSAKSKVSDLAARLGQPTENPPAKTARPKQKPPLLALAAQLEKQAMQARKFEDDQVTYMNYQHVPRVDEAAENDALEESGDENPPPVPEQKGIAEAPPPIAQRKPRATQAQPQEPHPQEPRPPPAPKRSRSFRSGRATGVINGKVGGGGGGSGGSTSGTSGDGMIVHPSPQRRSGCSTPGTSGDGMIVHPAPPRRGRGDGGHVIAPVNSSSESEYSGDGKVERYVS